MVSEIVAVSGATQIVSVIGADTFIGEHLVTHLSKNRQMVYGFSQKDFFCFDSEPIVESGKDNASVEPDPIISDVLFVCLEPDFGFETYICKIKGICTEILKTGFGGKIFLLSSGAVCLSQGAAISEESSVCPRTEKNLAWVTGEYIINMMGYDERCVATPGVIRIGSCYGNEIDFKSERNYGVINRMIYDAAKKHCIEVPIPGDALRTVTHISDVCESIIRLMSIEFLPDIINIPGEELSLSDISKKIAKRFNAKLSYFSPKANDQDFFVGDQHLSDELFKTQCDYVRQINFDEWLNSGNQIDDFLKSTYSKGKITYV